MLIAFIYTTIAPLLLTLLAFKYMKNNWISKVFFTIKSLIIFTLLSVVMPSISLGASTNSLGSDNQVVNILEPTPPISMRIKMDELREVFGKNKLWISLCNATITQYCEKPRVIGEDGGRIAKGGITISPYIEGEWRINKDYDIDYIEFTPTTYWLAKTNYTITIDKNSAPIFSSLKEDIISFQTQPLAPTIKEMAYLQDEYDLEKKFVQARIELN